MNSMKRALAFSTIFLLGSLSAWAQSDRPTDPSPSSPSAASRPFANPLLNEIVLMTQADLSEGTIIDYVRVRRSRLGSDVSADDLIGLRRAGVNEAVIRYIAGSVRIEGSADHRQNRRLNYDSSGETVPAQPPNGEGEGYDNIYSYGYGYPYAYGYGYPYAYGYGYPYGYPYQYGYGHYPSGRFIGGLGFGHRGFFGGRVYFGGGGHFGGGHFGGGHFSGGHFGGGHFGGGIGHR